MARSLKYKTITNYISMGVRIFHIKHNLPYIGIETHRIKAALAGVRRIKGDETSHKLPITVEMLEKIAERLDPGQPNDQCYWACCTIAFFCLLRKGNLTATKREGAERDTHVARRGDLSTDKSGCILLSFTHTKTIQFRERTMTVVLPRLMDKPELCPTRALCRYLRTSAEAQSDILLQKQDDDGTWVPYTYGDFMARLKADLKAIGEKPEAYAGHSFRRGGATWALKIGIPEVVVKPLGDWKSDAYMRYIQVDTEVRKKAAQAMAVATRALTAAARAVAAKRAPPPRAAG
jgi:hypothetical protein